MVIMSQSSSVTPLEVNETHHRDHDTDSRGSQTDSGNELSVGGSSSEGDSMSQHHAMNQLPDQAPSSQPNGLLGPVPINPSFTVLPPAFGTDFSSRQMFGPAQTGSLFDTPASILQSPQPHQFEMFSPTNFPAFAGKLPFRCVQCNQTAQNGVLQFLCSHKTCTTCLQNSSMSSDMRNGCSICGAAAVFNPLLHCSSPNGSLLLDASSPMSRGIATPQGPQSRPFSFSLSGLPVSPAPTQQLARMSTPNASGLRMRPALTLNDMESLSSTSSMWNPLVPPPLALKNISNLTPNSPMVHPAFDSLTTTDDTPVFSPLSPTNTSNMIPSSAVSTSESAVVPVAIAPPRSSVSSSTRTPITNAPPAIMIPPIQPINLETIPFNPLVLTQCQGCESNQPFAYCFECNESLCQHCVQAHQRVRATKQHRVVGIHLVIAHLMQRQQMMQQQQQDDVFHGQLQHQHQHRRGNGSAGSGGDGHTSYGETESLSGDSSPRSPSVCSVHESRIVGFCDHCPQTVALCAICVVQHPNKHRVQPIGDVRLAITELANESCLLEWQCEKTSEAIGRIVNTVMHNAAVAEKEVKTSIDAHVQAMEERRTELLKRVETVKQLKLSVLFAQAEMLKNKQADLKQAVQNASTLMDSGNGDEAQLRQTFEQLASCQVVGFATNGTSPNNGTPPVEHEPNNNLLNVMMLACQINEDERLKYNAPQDGSLMNKIRQFGNIESGPCAKTSTIVGDAYKKSIRERQSVINVQLRDACGDILSSSIAATQPVLQPLLPHQATSPHSHFEQCVPSADVQAIVLGPDGMPVDSTITPRENGLVVISYFPAAEGTYILNVLVKGTPITGCPASIEVRRGRNYEEIAAKGPIFTFGREGSGDGELCRPWGICVDLRGRVLVADRSNNRVQIFDKDGNFLSKFGTSGNRPGQFDRPAGLTTNNLNHIIVADKDNHRVQVFDENGTFLLKFGDRGRAVGYFNYPWGVATNSHNAIAVSDTRNHRVQIFTPQGQFVRKCGFDSAYFFKNLDSPRGLCYLPDGQLLITDFNNHRLAVLSPRNMSEMKVYGSEGDADGMFVRPQGVKIDPEGHILVCDSRNNRIQVFASEDMRFIGSFGLGPASNGFQMPTELPAPYSTLTGPFGAPAFSSTPTPLTPSPRQLLDRPTDLAVGPDGRIYVVDFGNNCVRVF